MLDPVILSFLVTIFLIFFFAIRKPFFLLGKRRVESYSVVALTGPVILFTLGVFPPLDASFFWDGEMSPIKILILFLSMVFVSIYLDHVGVLEYLARLTLRWAGGNGRKLFAALFVVVSFLTIFTSNDIIILTLTPFVYYFTTHAKLDPVPFLLAEFFAANSWSTFLPIGNPTNIYLLS
ncbi:MAG: SLC13 family permease, partial [archaeon]